MKFILFSLLVTLDAFATKPFAGAGGDLVPAYLLENEDVAGQFFLVGREGSHWHVFYIEKNSVREIPFTSTNGYYPNEDVTFNLVGRRRLVVFKADKIPGRYGRQSDAYLVHPDRAREHFILRDFSNASLVAMGVDVRLAPAHEMPYRDPSAFLMPEDVGLIVVTISALFDFDQRHALTAAFKKDLGDLALVVDRGASLSANTALLLVAKNNESEVINRLRSHPIQSFAVLRNDHEIVGSLYHQSIPFAFEQLRNLKSTPPLQVIGSLDFIVTHPDAWVKSAGRTEISSLAHALDFYDGFINALGEINLATTHALVGHWTGNGILSRTNQDLARHMAEASDFQLRIVGPLRAHYARTLEALLKTNSLDLNRLVLTRTHLAGSALLGALDEPTAFGGKSATDVWFDETSERLSRVADPNTYPGHDESNPPWRRSEYHASILPDLRVLVRLVDVYPNLSDELMPYGGRITYAPLWKLGAAGSTRNLRVRLINLIIKADQDVASALPRLNEIALNDKGAGLKNLIATGAMRPEPYEGSTSLFEFISGLADPGFNLRSSPEFNEKLYRGRLVEIVLELLEDASDVLATRGTYFALTQLAFKLVGADVDGDYLSKQDQLKDRLWRWSLQALPSVLKQCEDLLVPTKFRLSAVTSGQKLSK